MELRTKILVPLITCFLLVFLALALFIMLNRGRGPAHNRCPAGGEQARYAGANGLLASVHKTPAACIVNVGRKIL